MRTRVLFTDGTRTIDLYWIIHTGTDVYHGIPGMNRKTSYHQSGKVHAKEGREKVYEWDSVPLAELKGMFQLTGLAFSNIEGMLKPTSPFKSYSGGKSDTVLTIDRRSIPDGHALALNFLLVESGNHEALGEAIRDLQQDGYWSRTQQVAIAAAVHPWVVVTFSITSG